MWNDKSGQIYCRDSQIKFEVIPDKKNNYFELCDYSRYIQSYLNRQIIILLSALGIEDRYFEKKLNEYKKKLNDQKFVLSLIHYIEWNQMLQKMNSCGINRINDRFSRSIIESNLDILYKDIKNKARIYVEESAYVIGIMDEYNILEYGEAYLQIKRDNFNIILDKKCTVAKCPCLHPGDIRVLRFRKYNKNNESTKKYEVFNNYENVIIFPSKGKRPHPDECSGSDLDGDNYFVFYDNDLIPKKTVEPMSYIVDKKEEDKAPEFTINNVIEYFAEYTNFNNLGLIGDAHLAWADQKTANSEICLTLAKKFSKAVDAPKTGDKITLDEDETPKQFPHFMGKKKDKHIPQQKYWEDYMINHAN
jgi:RNA-dependent RNA polymerase